MKGKRNENYVARIRRKGEIGLNNYFALAAVSVHSFLKQRGIKIVPLHVSFSCSALQQRYALGNCGGLIRACAASKRAWE
jgi:hypothetical protein